MHYFILEQAEFEEFGQYVIAEMVAGPREWLGLSTAGLPERRLRELQLLDDGLAWHHEILTREELIATPKGRKALKAWEAQDDRAFEGNYIRAVQAGIEEDTSRRRLRSV